METCIAFWSCPVNCGPVDRSHPLCTRVSRWMTGVSNDCLCVAPGLSQHIHLIQRCAHMSKNTNLWWSTSFRGLHTCPKAQNRDYLPHSEACTHVQEHKPWWLIHFIQRQACMSKNTNHDDPPHSEACMHVQEHKILMQWVFLSECNFEEKKNHMPWKTNLGLSFSCFDLWGPTVAPLVAGRALSEWGLCKWLCVFNQSQTIFMREKKWAEQLIFP